MHSAISRHHEAIVALCRRFDVRRLDVFGSAARADDFDPQRSDADFLVEFGVDGRHDMAGFVALRSALETELGISVDLIDRAGVERSRNYIRRQNILSDAQPVFRA